MATDETCAQRNKATVRRLTAEVLNGGLDVIDGLYSSGLAGSTRAWIEQFRAPFPGVRTDIIDLIAEDGIITQPGMLFGSTGHPHTHPG